ncbi:hypothetical protein PG991_015324 [Apiospora marii]|uniref:Uncharacterized protein n=1 Tax=Apiospora marii TaxID=335849 RepID=A0ABR1R1D2_9PEZI
MDTWARTGELRRQGYGLPSEKSAVEGARVGLAKRQGAQSVIPLRDHVVHVAAVDREPDARYAVVHHDGRHGAREGVVAAAAPIPIEKRWVGGWCGVHVQVIINERGDRQSAAVTLFDGAQTWIHKEDIPAAPKAHSGNRPFHGEAPGLKSPMQLSIAIDGNLVDFTYEGDHWSSGAAGSSNDRCTVGQWDSHGGRFIPDTVDLDCGFPC